ncbi:MAG: hypothetical protein COV99_11845 [Bacteroidetes bacterium CG12_big_fil_rev_8_21_14_0_65_60_17]|nr:MAG: hypothetical protein COV99_11845 [Bacteroidetes bacterium CG12_big_fil_rev_8_21_14_0_65_60_17]
MEGDATGMGRNPGLEIVWLSGKYGPDAGQILVGERISGLAVSPFGDTTGQQHAYVFFDFSGCGNRALRHLHIRCNGARRTYFKDSDTIIHAQQNVSCLVDGQRTRVYIGAVSIEADFRGFSGWRSDGHGHGAKVYCSCGVSAVACKT